MPPTIGVETDIDVIRRKVGPEECENYAAAIRAAGGHAEKIKYGMDINSIPWILDRYDGLVFSGGEDIEPSRYGQTKHPEAVLMDPIRERFAFALIAEAERRRIPVLGICLGMQLMNVYRGGSLYQFLPDFAKGEEHRRIVKGVETWHDVLVICGTRLHKALQTTRLKVNSSHKQAVDKLGDRLQRAAVSDMATEAVEDKDPRRFFVGVQWHPERIVANKYPGWEGNLGLFRDLVGAATEYRRQRGARASQRGFGQPAYSQAW